MTRRTLQQSWIESGLLHDTHPLHDTTVIMANNAWEYTDQHGWLNDRDLIQTANIAPVLNDFLVQFDFSEDGDTMPVGLHFKSSQLLGDNDQHIGWMYKVGMYWHPSLHVNRLVERSRFSEPLMLFTLYCDTDGNATGKASSTMAPYFEQSFDDPNAKSKIGWLLVPALFAINLMHCKNVHLVENELTRRERRMSKKHNKPLYRYHMLKIATGKGAYSGGSASNSGITMAHHICRGHFRTYGDHAPLFGKYTGTFWIPSHVKGRKSNGVVEKDYQVEGETDDTTK